MDKNSTQTSIAQAMSWATKTLHHIDSAQLDARVLLCHVLNCNVTYLMTWPEKSLSEQQSNIYKELINQRQLGHPVAHLVGYRDFWSLKLKVSTSTLIPRPETELLIEVCTSLKLPSKARVLDLGTGTGAIALSLAFELPSWDLTAVDFKEQAVSLAQENAKLNNITNVSFLQSDWFENIPENKFNAIVSNPPYVEANSPYLKQGDVRFEPLSALTSGQDGLDDIRHILQTSVDYLAPGGWVLLEHGYEQAAPVQKLFSNNGFSEICTHKDLANLPRVTLGRLNS